MSTTGFGGRSLIPDEMLEGYGPHASLPNGYLWRPAAPLRGHATRGVGYPSPSIIAIAVGLSEFRLNGTRILIWQATYDAIIGGIRRNQSQGDPPGNPAFVFRWRAEGSSDTWKEVPGQYLGVNLQTADSVYTEGARVVGTIGIDDARLNPLLPEYDASVADLPADDEIIEFYLVGPMPPDEQHPVIIEDLTAGQVAVNVYAGLYSPRDPVTGAAIPTGILYDEPAFAAMTDLVRIRLDKPVEDARDWLEKFIYQPTGWAPALDRLGRISPVSQVPPTDTSTLPVIQDVDTQPSPEWNAGSRIINVLRFTYPRDFSQGDPDPPGELTGDHERRQDILGERPIVQEFRDEVSIERFGEQVLEIDGSAFRAIGRDPTTLEEADLDPNNIPPRRPRDLGRRRRQTSFGLLPVTQTPVVRTGQYVLPVSGDIEDEVGWQLAQDRGNYLLARYALGAPTVQVHVRRSAIPDVRCGSYVILNLSWFPDYVTQRRGLLALGQVVAIGELNCHWRRLLVEVVNPPATSS